MYEIVQGDFRRLNCPPEASIVFTDPPYNLGKVYGNVKEFYPFNCWVTEILSWSNAPRTVILGPWNSMFKWMPLIPEPDRILVWHKTFVKPGGKLCSWTDSLTPVLVYECPDAPWYGPDRNNRHWHNCIDAIGSFGDISHMRKLGIKLKHHPSMTGTQFPAKLLRGYVTAGDCVVDPMCGSGSVLVAALRMGCDAWGCDVVPSYCEFANLWLLHESRML